MKACTVWAKHWKTDRKWNVITWDTGSGYISLTHEPPLVIGLPSIHASAWLAAATIQSFSLSLAWPTTEVGVIETKMTHQRALWLWYELFRAFLPAANLPINLVYQPRGAAIFLTYLAKPCRKIFDASQMGSGICIYQVHKVLTQPFHTHRFPVLIFSHYNP